jgi:hypothetical protein
LEYYSGCGFSWGGRMTRLMEEAIESLRNDVPPEHQDEIARLVMQLTGRNQTIYALSAEEQADLDQADAEMTRGEFATDEQVRAVWAKHGL